MNTDIFSTHIKAVNVRITDSFWKEKLELVRTQVIPYQYDALHDRIDEAPKSYCVDNFIKAGKVVDKRKKGESVPVYPTDKWCYDENNAPEEAFHGWVFQDSDVYKWIEAVGFSLINHPDKKLENEAKRIIETICSAQMSDGYLDTLFIINDISGRFTNLKDRHELYCFGHLAEAAVSFYNATGDKKLLDSVCRFADLIAETFGENKIKGYPGHEIAEMALVKLYEVTGNEKYLDCAGFFIDERGKKPYYYDTVLGKKTVNDNYHYNQAHKPPRTQYEAVGHAVRGVYLYSGMADIAKYRKDDELYLACKKLADNIINRKMYVTGGIGATVDGEAFSFDYDLPNDLAYSETCASIGLIFFLRRMLEIKPDAIIGDTVERALYNTVLAGMSLDGKSFFYVNPLEVLPEASHKDSRKRHVKPVRQKWFGCACCPPNLARLIASVGEYIFTENENTLFVHQYIGCDINSENAKLDIISDYLNSGEITIRIKPRKSFNLALRIPLWCKEYSFTGEYVLKEGYAYFSINEDTELKVRFAVDIRMVKCSNKVRANLDKTVISRGPFVFCLEEADNGKDLQMLKISRSPDFSYNDGIITADGFREKESDSLYSEWKESEVIPVKLKFIPYYTWANRGEGEMQVFVRI